MNKSAEYYKTWADRLSTATGAQYTPEWIADAERRSGKAIAEMTPVDFENAAKQLEAEAAEARAEADRDRMAIEILKLTGVPTMNDAAALLGQDISEFTATELAELLELARRYAQARA
jgi:hypothetical protein